MAWMPGDAEAAAAVEGMQEIYGRNTALTITPDVRRRDGLDRVILSRLSGDRIRIVVLQRVGDDGTDSSAGRWNVSDAFAVCQFGAREAIVSRPPALVDRLDVMAAAAERWCRLGAWL